jgi:hypothetical protein
MRTRRHGRLTAANDSAGVLGAGPVQAIVTGREPRWLELKSLRDGIIPLSWSAPPELVRAGSRNGRVRQCSAAVDQESANLIDITVAVRPRAVIADDRGAAGLVVGDLVDHEQGRRRRQVEQLEVFGISQ